MYTFIYQHTRIYTAMMYSNCLAAICDHADPSWRSSALGAYRFWRDMGYAYTHIYLHAYTHIGLHTNMYIHTYVCIYIYILHIYLSLLTLLCARRILFQARFDLRVCIHLHAYVCAHTCICIYLDIFVYAYMYIYANIYTFWWCSAVVADRIWCGDWVTGTYIYRCLTLCFLHIFIYVCSLYVHVYIYMQESTIHIHILS